MILTLLFDSEFQFLFESRIWGLNLAFKTTFQGVKQIHLMEDTCFLFDRWEYTQVGFNFIFVKVCSASLLILTFALGEEASPIDTFNDSSIVSLYLTGHIGEERDTRTSFLHFIGVLVQSSDRVWDMRIPPIVDCINLIPSLNHTHITGAKFNH